MCSEPNIDGTSALDFQPQQVRTLAPVAALPTSPAEMLYLAMARGDSMDVIEKFMNLKDRWEAGEAKKAYTKAMSEFKGHNIVVIKDRANVQYGSRYTSLGNLVSTVTPYLSQHGLSVNWDVDQTKTGIIRVTCTMTHEMGHSETFPFECAPDKSGAKTPIQEIKSAITYAKSVTFENACGLASTDANLDDDGNSAGRRQGAAESSLDLETELKKIGSAKTVPELVQVFNAAYAIAQKAKDRPAQDQLMLAQRQRQDELKPKKGESK